MSKAKNILFVLIVAIVILVLALIFHYPVHIEDTLTGQVAEGFGIHISFWRVLFEPFVGPLLFYLRANKPLVEFLILMFWVMIGFLPFAVVQAGKRRRLAGVRSVMPGVLRWMAYLPIILSVWVMLILVLIFAPLPSNTLVNNTTDKVLVNTHSHTYYSHDGLISPVNLMRWHKRNAFDAFFITDHNHHARTLESVRKQQRGELPANPLILCGEEYSGSNHMVLLGLTRDFKTKDMADSTAIDSAHAQNGVTVIAHWFADRHRTIQYYIDCGADGFEIANQAEGIHYDIDVIDDIIANCRQNNLIMLGGCDYHGYGTACFTWNALTIPGWKELDRQSKSEAIMDIFRRHEQDKINVLVYRDRRFFPDSRLIWSPIYTFIDYFRSLTWYQVASWLIWLVLFTFWKNWSVCRKYLQWLKTSDYRGAAVLGLFSAAFTMVVGLVLLSKAPGLRGYNDIFREYGMDFTIGGAVFLLYSLAMLFLKGLKKS